MSVRTAATLFLSIVVVGAIAAVSAAVAAQRGAAADVPPLVPGAEIRREIRPGETHRYRVDLHSQDFLKVVIQQQGIDVSAALLRPDGSTHVEVDAESDTFLTETVAAVADVDGSHVLTVGAGPSKAPSGWYVVRTEDVRPATARDSRFVQAERTFGRGRALTATNRIPVFPQALEELNAALQAYTELRDRRGEMKTLIQIANAEWTLGRPHALEVARQAEEIARELGDEAARAFALHALGGAQEYAGDLDGALRSHEAATAIDQATGNRKAEAISLNAEAIIYGRTGDPERAIARLERALELAREVAYPFLEQAVLNNLGVSYRNVGEFERALKAYSEALPLAHEMNSRIEPAILNNMGNLERRLGNLDASLELHTKALSVARQVSERANEARALSSIGRVQFARGEHDKAVASHRQALEIRRAMNDLDGQAASLDGLGRALHGAGDDEAAVAALDGALALRRALKDIQGEGDALEALTTIARDRGDLATAIDRIRNALELDETIRSQITSPQLRSTFAAAEHDKYETYIDLLQDQHRRDPSAGHDARALEISERARARVLLESMLDGRVDLKEGVDPELLQRERSLQQRIRDASAQLTRSTASGRSGPAATAAAETLERLTSDYQRLEAEIRARSPHYASVTQPRPLDARAIQERVLDDRTVLLEFALGETRSWLWAVTSTSITTAQLPPRSEIERAAMSLYQQFTARQLRGGTGAAASIARVADADRRIRKEAPAVSRMLFGAVADRLQGEWRGKRLAIVSSGALDYLPFAALPVSDRPRAPLLGSEFEIVGLPSASVLAAIRAETTPRPRAPRPVAILADPVFEREDARVAAVADREATRAAERRTAGTRSAGEPGDLRTGFARLPFSRQEAEAIASLVPGGAAFKAMDFRASRAVALSGALQGYRIVHFATHGVVDGSRPALSGLILSLVDARGRPQDGFVRLHDIYNMRVDADLVVLSACQTALGKQIKGEGLVGLARAFMYAGAPRVVASLWQVSDVATAELMKRFYRHMLQDKLAPAAALRAAQLEMARTPRWSAPYYWAGFVIQGDWR